jgi:hypothetical protein
MNSIIDNVINLLRQFSKGKITLLSAAKAIHDLYSPLRWIEFDFLDPEARPTKPDKYLVIRKDGKIHWETWNGNSWAYNSDSIRQWAVITRPYEMKMKEIITLTESQESFNNISDLRRYLLGHPDKEMVRASCLHFLGDNFQKLFHSSSSEEIINAFGTECKATTVGNTTIIDGSYGKTYVDNPILKDPDDLYYTGSGATWDTDSDGNRYWKRYHPLKTIGDQYRHLNYGDIVNERARIESIVRDVIKELSR